MAAIKSVPSLLLALAALPVVAGASVAQTKVAWVASEAILERLNEAKLARTRLAELQSGWMRDIARQEQEITTLRGEIQSNRLLWSDQEKREAEAKLADLQSKLVAFRSARFGPKGDFERQHDELMGPVIERMAQAIQEEARAQKYDYVLDRSSRGMSMLFANPSHDLTVAVLKRLGVDVTDMPAASAPQVDPAAERAAQEARRNRGRRGGNDPNEIPVDPNSALQPPIDQAPPPEKSADPR